MNKRGRETTTNLDTARKENYFSPWKKRVNRTIVLSGDVMWRERESRSIIEIDIEGMSVNGLAVMEVSRGVKHSFDCVCLIFSFSPSTHEFRLGILRTHSLHSPSRFSFCLMIEKIPPNTSGECRADGRTHTQDQSRDQCVTPPSSSPLCQPDDDCYDFSPVVKRDFPKVALLKN